MSGSGTTYTVTVNTGSGDGTIRLDLLDDDTIQDIVGNPLDGPGLGNGNHRWQVYRRIDKIPPVISEDDSISVLMNRNGSPNAFNLTLHAVDADTLTWSISSPASHRAATANGTGASKGISYFPVNDFVGLDSFVVQVVDRSGWTDSITVNVGIFEVERLSARSHHTCWLKDDGSVFCWGDNTFGQTTVPAGTYKQVSVGWDFSCGLKSDGNILCWGDDYEGVITYVPAGTFTQVSAGAYHACGLRTNGSIACWGFDDQGQTYAPTGSLPSKFLQASTTAVV